MMRLQHFLEYLIAAFSTCPMTSCGTFCAGELLAVGCPAHSDGLCRRASLCAHHTHMLATCSRALTATTLTLLPQCRAPRRCGLPLLPRTAPAHPHWWAPAIATPHALPRPLPEGLPPAWHLLRRRAAGTAPQGSHPPSQLPANEVRPRMLGMVTSRLLAGRSSRAE